MPPRSNKTSWEGVDKWYDTLVGEEGHYYHTHLVMPNLVRLLKLRTGDRLLDLACGQGVLARNIPEGVDYFGIDLAPSLIQKAKQYKKGRFAIGDITKPLPVPAGATFTHAAIVLALQNVEKPDSALLETARHLERGGRLVVVLNHPCYRIPRQTSWGIDEQQNMQYRRVNRYMTPLQIPIRMHPGKGEKAETTWSFHFPITAFCQCLFESGFAIIGFEEWVSDKKSTGKNAKRENLARSEFPLFLAIIAQKS